MRKTAMYTWTYLRSRVRFVCRSALMVCLLINTNGFAQPDIPEVIPNGVLDQPIKFHPLYIPFDWNQHGKGEYVPPAPVPSLPEQWPSSFEEEDTSNLIEQWKLRPDPDEYQDLVRRALSLSARPLGSDFQPSSATYWSQIGIGINHPDNVHHMAGRLRGAAYAYDNSQGLTVLWVGSSSGGLWKVVIIFIFAIWTQVSENLPGAPSVGAFLVKPNDSSHILIGTGDYQRYPGDGIWRTTNSGATWARILVSGAQPQVVFKILLDKNDPTHNTVLAATDQGIFRSTNFGQTWSRVFSGFTSDLVQNPVNPWIWYAGRYGRGVLRSVDYGQTFSPIGSGINGVINRVSVALCDSAPNYVYAVVEGDQGRLNNVYRSSNHGLNWVPIDTMDTISGGQGFHTCAIGVDPSNPARVFVGMAGLQYTNTATAVNPTWYRSIDGGHADYTSFLFRPNTNEVIITNDGGYYVHNYVNNTVSGQGNLLNLNVQQIMQAHGALAGSRTVPDLMLSGLQDNGMVRINRTVNPNILFLGGGDGGQASIAPARPEWFFASIGADFARFYSTNSGSSWNGVNCSFGVEWASSVIVQQVPGLSNPLMFTYTNSDSGANIGNYIWYKPVSSSCNWTRVNGGNPFPSDFRAKQVDGATDPNRHVLYSTSWGGDSRLLVIDGYVHGNLGSMEWANRTPPLPAMTRRDAIAYADRSQWQPGTVYYTTSSGRPSRAFLSTNRGVTWSDVTGNLTTIMPDAHYWELVAHPFNLNQLFLVTNVGIFRSDSFGRYWYRYMNGLPAVVDVRNIELNFDGQPSNPTLRIGTYGRGFWDRPIDNDAVPPGGWRNFTPSAVVYGSAQTCSVQVRDLPDGELISGLSISNRGWYRYSTNGGGTWSNWAGVTTLTGANGTPDFQTLTVTNVPFPQASATQNKIQFAIQDMANNWGYSPEYTVQTTDAFTLTDGNATYTLRGTFGAQYRETAGGSGDLNAGRGDILFHDWWWYRMNGNPREYALSNLALWNKPAANRMQLTYSEPDDPGSTRRVTFELEYTLTGTGNGSAILSTVFRMRNTSGISRTFSFYSYADFDISNPDAANRLSTFQMQQTSGATCVNYISSVTPSFWEIASYANLLAKLINSTADNFANTISPFTGDVTMGFQWNRVIESGLSFTGILTKSINGHARAGDANNDSCVDDADLLVVLLNFGATGLALPADLNCDGTVDDVDMLLVLSNFGNGC